MFDKPDDPNEWVRSIARLRIYIARHCTNCAEALELGHLARRLFPELLVELIDLDDVSADGVPGEAHEDSVFAVPTYVLNGHILFLGNPSEEELVSVLSEALESSRGEEV